MDLNWVDVVHFSHALNFDEFDKVSILIRVSLVFVHIDDSVLLLSDVGDNERLGLLSVVVSDDKIRSIVQEDIASSSQSLTKNETCLVVSKGSIHCHDLGTIE